MAIYHCKVKVIKRKNGSSAVGAAAYRSGGILTSDYIGKKYDYSKKGWIEHAEVMLCPNAPPDYQNRENLWNAVESVEKSSDAQLAREVEVALPVELSLEDQLDVLHTYIEKNFTSKGMCADFAIHNPPVKNDRNQPIDAEGNPTHDISQMTFRNPHAHVMLTMRPIDASGKWEAKSQLEYLCKKNGIEQAFTASEFNQRKDEGWEKQYKYKDSKKNIWLTPSEADGRNLKRVNRTPKSSPYGRKNPTVEYWNAKERVFVWRNSWEDIVNQKFKEKSMDIRIDARSFKEQGREDEIPSVHMGVNATNMQRRAERELREGKSVEQVQFSELSQINEDIRRHNSLVKAFKKEMERIYQEAKKIASDTIKSLAQRLEIIRAKIIGNEYQHTYFKRKYHVKNFNLDMEADRIKRITASEEELTKYRHDLEKLEKVKNTIRDIENDISNLSKTYQQESEKIASDNQEQIEQYRKKYRSQAEAAIKNRLQEHYGNSFDENNFKKSTKKTDNLINKFKNKNSEIRKENSPTREK